MLNQKSQTLNVAYLPDCHLWIVYHFAIAVPNACLIVYCVAFNANGYRWPMQIECGRHAWLHTIWTERKSACSIDFHMWQLRLHTMKEQERIVVDILLANIHWNVYIKYSQYCCFDWTWPTENEYYWWTMCVELAPNQCTHRPNDSISKSHWDCVHKHTIYSHRWPWKISH